MKRFVPLAMALAAAGSIAASAPAGALGGGITPGHIDSSGAGLFGDAFDSQTDFSAQISTGIETFRPRKPSGPLVTMQANVVNLSVNSQAVGGFGCWLVPASDITINADLSATLTFDSSDPAVSLCPGDPIGTSVLGATPGPPADGLIQGLVGEVKATMTWTPASPTVTTRVTAKETCGAFKSINEGTGRSDTSTVSATIMATVEGYSYFYQQVIDVPVDAQLSGGSGDVQTGSDVINIQGPATGQCGQFG